MENSHEFLTENKYPTLSVKNFGKISEAHIELAPFTLFIGDNNSGKSYLLNLIWGLQKEICEGIGFFTIYRNEYIRKEKAYIDIFKKLDSIIELSLEKYEKKKIDFNQVDINNIMILINKMLHESKNNLIKSLFNSDDVSADEVSLFIPKNTNIEFTIETDTKEKIFRLMHDDTSDIFPFSDSEEIFKYIIQILVSSVLFKLFPFNIPRIKGLVFPIFFPTSRTGFLLTYKELAKKAISEKYQIRTAVPDTSSTIFLHSTVSFIDKLLSLDLKSGSIKVNSIIEYIENDIIHGKLFMHPETMEFIFIPEGTNMQFKMHTSSAVVTELAPLILYLKYHKLAGAMFMEEPEISLHPKLQEKITRVLIKLLNSCNQQIFISTHSDTITQHINNMIKLGNNPLQKQDALFTELGYDKNDALKQEDVRMYQFDVDSTTQKTTISSLVSSPYGFRTPTFGDFLTNVGNQIDTLLEDLEL